MWTERAVHKDLDRADTQPIIPEACAEPELIGLIEQLYRDVLEDTQLEPALFMKLLQRHERIAAVKIVDAGQTHFP